MTLAAAPEHPRISLIIPTFNRAAMLAEAVASALAQTWPNLEIIVSDNASEDATAELMAGFQGDPRLRYHRNPTNVGMVGNWRQAVRDLATGDFFLILSDDDLLLDPDYLAKVARIIREHPEVVLVYGEGYVLDTQTDTRRELRLPFAEVQPGGHILATRNQIRPQDFVLCNVVFHRRLALELDAFSDPLDLSCDSELFLNLCLFGQVGVVKGFASLYRLHGGNLIKTVHGNADFLAHSMRMYVHPYRRALERGTLTGRELAAFERIFRTALMRTMLVMLERHPARFEEFMADMKSAAPRIVRKVYRWPRFLRKRATLWLRQRMASLF
jgi:glycosyltransferase involved in cell wall biosynthesis